MRKVHDVEAGHLVVTDPDEKHTTGEPVKTEGEKGAPPSETVNETPSSDMLPVETGAGNETPPPEVPPTETEEETPEEQIGNDEPPAELACDTSSLEAKLENKSENKPLEQSASKASPCYMFTLTGGASFKCMGIKFEKGIPTPVTKENLAKRLRKTGFFEEGE